MPEMLALARSGDFAPLVAASLVVHRRPARAVQRGAALLGDVRRGRAARHARRAEQRRRATARVRALARRTIAVCDRWPRGTLSGRLRAARQERRAGAAAVGRPRSGDAAGVRRRGREGRFRTSRHIVARGFGHIVSPHACAPRLIARVRRRRGLRDAAADRASTSSSNAASAAVARPPGAAAMIDVDGLREVVRQEARGAGGRRRDVRRARRRDHRPARPERRRQDDAAAHARDAGDARRRHARRRRPRRRRATATRCAAASACCPTRAASTRA